MRHHLLAREMDAPLLRPMLRLLRSTNRLPPSSRLFHSSPAPAMHIHPVPVRDDNYAYVIIDPKHPKKGVFVDPFDLPACQEAAKKLGVEEVVGNITTHHHFDHSGGNEAFAKAYPSAKVYGGSDQIPALTNAVKEGDHFALFDGSSINVTTRKTPCHTQDSTAFFLEDANQSVTKGKDYARGVFTGDTLFISGCGRFFEGERALRGGCTVLRKSGGSGLITSCQLTGTPEQMNTALNKTLASLPGDTVVFCGHEYTKANVAFSQGVLPNRPAIKSLVSFVQERKNNGVTTGVFTIDDEKKHNVFMMVEDAEVQEAMGLKGKSAIEVMGALREAKNSGKMMSKV